MKRTFAVLLLFAMLAFPSAALADVAPPSNPPGANPQPGAASTQVRMMAETVLIDVKNDTTPGSLGSAAITADFRMRDLGSADESMAVRFPIAANNGFDKYPEITNIVIKVNGTQARYRRATYPDVRFPSLGTAAWAEFDVTFPAGQDVSIQVAYDLQGSGYPNLPFAAYYYILETGAGWNGTIGSADITLRLPYAADPENILLESSFGPQTSPGGSIQGNEMHWHFDDFEPGPNGTVDNMEFDLVAPSAWQNVLKYRAATSSTPGDGESWGQLGKAYKAIFFLNKAYRMDAGGEQIYRSAVEAYEKCLAVLPNDAEWHAGFAELLGSRSYWDFSANGATADTLRALQEIHTALQLAPGDAKVQNIAQEIASMYPQGMTQNGTAYDFPWLTETPTPEPASAATVTPAAATSAAPTPASPSLPIPVPTDHPQTPFCGAAALAPVALALWARRRRGQV